MIFFFNKRRKAKRKGRRAEWAEEERRKEKILKKIHIPWYHTIEYLNYESIIPNDCLLTSTFSLGILIACVITDQISTNPGDDQERQGVLSP